MLCGLAWLYILDGASLGMSAWDMTRVVLFPHGRAADGMAGMASWPASGWDVAHWAIIIAMWWAMMVAMMVPSAAPAILLYAKVYRHASSFGRRPSGLAPTGAFTAGYLLVWLAFSLAAAGLHWALEQSGAVSGATMGSQNRWLSAVIPAVAGLYQFTPLKNVCLVRCRAPLSFLTRHWRPGVAGALLLGAMHGGFCVGCCWALMTLLFVGGAMNLFWIAILTGLVVIEKLIPLGGWIGRAFGLLLVGWGLVAFLA